MTNNRKYQSLNKNWKQEIVRRKNYGTYGEVFKGKAKDKFFAFVNRPNTI